ncbi:MAG: hypothetical protein QW145_05085 [Candidatus Bathyarchaeia archaeon]
MKDVKMWLKIILGCALFVIGAIAGFYQITLQPKASVLLSNPFAGINMLLIFLPFIAVSGLILGVWIVLRATESE